MIVQEVLGHPERRAVRSTPNDERVRQPARTISVDACNHTLGNDFRKSLLPFITFQSAIYNTSECVLCFSNFSRVLAVTSAKHVQPCGLNPHAI